MFAAWPPGFRSGLRQEEALPQRRLQRDHARRPLFPGRQRLHPDLRPDAQRQSRARLDLPAGRLFRLHDASTRPVPGCFSFVVAFVVAALLGVVLQVAVFRRMEGQELRQTLVTIGISIVLADLMLWAFGGNSWQIQTPALASRTDRPSLRHRGQVVGRGGLSLLSDRSSGHLRRLGRDRRGDVAGRSTAPASA